MERVPRLMQQKREGAEPCVYGAALDNVSLPLQRTHRKWWRDRFWGHRPGVKTWREKFSFFIYVVSFCLNFSFRPVKMWIHFLFFLQLKRKCPCKWSPSRQRAWSRSQRPRGERSWVRCLRRQRGPSPEEAGGRWGFQDPLYLFGDLPLEKAGGTGSTTPPTRGRADSTLGSGWVWGLTVELWHRAGLQFKFPSLAMWPPSPPGVAFPSSLCSSFLGSMLSPPPFLGWLSRAWSRCPGALPSVSAWSSPASDSLAGETQLNPAAWPHLSGSLEMVD